MLLATSHNQVGGGGGFLFDHTLEKWETPEELPKKPIVLLIAVLSRYATTRGIPYKRM